MRYLFLVALLVASFVILIWLTDPETVTVARVNVEPTSSLRIGEWHAGEEEVVQLIGDITLFLQKKSSSSQPLWPHERFSAIPQLLTFDNKHSYGLFLPILPDGWTPKKIAQHTALFYDGTRAQQQQEQPTFDDISTFTYHLELDKEGYYEPLVSYLREYIQTVSTIKSWGPYPLTIESCRDEWQWENIVLQQIEAMLLSDFLNVCDDSEISFYMKTGYLKDFLAVYEVRMRSLQPQTRLWEESLQTDEGLNELLVTEAFEQSRLLPRFSQRAFILAALQKELVQDDLIDQCFVTRHRKIGAAIAVALNFLEREKQTDSKDSWKGQMQEGRYTLVQLLQNKLESTAQEQSVRLERLLPRYRHEELREHVKRYLEEYSQELEELEEDFNTMEGVILAVKLPKSLAPSFDFTRAQQFYWHAAGKVVLLNNRMRIKDLAMGLDLKFVSMPIASVDLKENIFLFKECSKLILEIDGESYNLRELLRRYSNRIIAFQSLAWRGCNSKLKLLNRGVLTLSNGQATVTLDASEYNQKGPKE